MAKIPIIVESVNEIDFIIDYIQTKISLYDLNELTGGNMGDTPNIVSAHPLAMEYGNYINSGDGNYTSILPAIGIELINDDDYSQQFMGSGNRPFEITQDYIDEINGITLGDRFKNGIILSNTNLTGIQTQKTNKGSEKLWSTKTTYMMNQNVNISCWSNHPQITRILYLALRGILHELKHELFKNKAQNASLGGQCGIYNYEFSETLFGGEFNLRFINNHTNIEVNSDTETINKIDVSKLGVTDKSKSEFKGVSE